MESRAGAGWEGQTQRTSPFFFLWVSLLLYGPLSNLFVSRNFLNTYLDICHPHSPQSKAQILFLSHKPFDVSLHITSLKLQPLLTFSPQACSPLPLSLETCCCSLYLGHSFYTAPSLVSPSANHLLTLISTASVPLSRAASPSSSE